MHDSHITNTGHHAIVYQARPSLTLQKGERESSLIDEFASKCTQTEIALENISVCILVWYFLSVLEGFHILHIGNSV